MKKFYSEIRFKHLELEFLRLNAQLFLQKTLNTIAIYMAVQWMGKLLTGFTRTKKPN
jgi:hypothetical protein